MKQYLVYYCIYDRHGLLIGRGNAMLAVKDDEVFGLETSKKNILDAVLLENPKLNAHSLVIKSMTLL